MGGNLVQDHEMIHAPMQHTGQLQVGQVRQIQLQRAGVQAQRLGDGDQPPERGALQRNREAPPHRRQVDLVTVKARYHGHAGQPALGRLGLQHQGQARLAEERQQQRGAHHFPEMLNSGSSAHS